MSLKSPSSASSRMDSVLLAVIANRLNAICREMTNTLQRSGRSAILSMGRDFSCAIVTPEGELLVSAESLPVHILGIEFQARSLRELASSVEEGDAFLHNDPYNGNTHHADHTILVPVFFDGVHMFTACAKAHQADIGNSVPTTYAPYVRDIYEEGALNFPCVRVQREYQDVDDIIRMCRRRIRVPDQWYGDYLAMVGAARIGERRIHELLAKYGVATIHDFSAAWFDYSERRMARVIERLPKKRLVGSSRMDPYPGAPDGLTLNVSIDIDPERPQITIDLQDNPDCIPSGLNLSQATSTSAAVAGLFNSIDPDIPHNAGTFRRIQVLLRRGCVVGIPNHPTSCSMATTHVADRVVNMVQSAFTQLGSEFGLAEGGLGHAPSLAVVSGRDWRVGGDPFINQLMLGATGGPASPTADGWVNYVLPVAGGLQYRDSVEVDEQKYPLHVEEQRLLIDSGGPGRRRGAPGSLVVYGPKRDPMTVSQAVDGHDYPAAGVRGGGAGIAADAALKTETGETVDVKLVGAVELKPNERIVSISCGGGGYGDPLDRETARVLDDVREGWVSAEQARDVYGVIFTTSGQGELSVDKVGTERLRSSRRDFIHSHS